MTPRRCAVIVAAWLPPMSGADKGSADSENAETQRIRDVYRKRPKVEAGFRPDVLFMAQGRARAMLALLGKHRSPRLASCKILEVGCGSGFWLREFVQWGAEPSSVFGIDLIEGLVAEAKRKSHPAISISCGNAESMSFSDASFDIVVQSTVFTSVLDSRMRRKLAAEMLRVLKPEGIILWYDFRVDNPRNPDVRGVGKNEIHELFAGCRVDLRAATLAPPLTRFLAPYSVLACEILERVPLLCTHYAGAIRKA